MKPEHIFFVSLTIFGAIIAAESFYKHSTYGTGVQAIYALSKAALVIT